MRVLMRVPGKNHRETIHFFLFQFSQINSWHKTFHKTRTDARAHRKRMKTYF